MGSATETDLKRTLALAEYLAEIHSRRRNEPSLYTRRIREPVGHGECIMGLIDNYPDLFEFIDIALLRQIELSCVDWRWKIKRRGHRLCQVHGDFHPWNILFRAGQDFILLDRSRGEWGEPADDVSCLTINYLFYSLFRSGRLAEPFDSMFVRFWERYLERTTDAELLEVVAPFYACARTAGDCPPARRTCHRSGFARRSAASSPELVSRPWSRCCLRARRRI